MLWRYIANIGGTGFIMTGMKSHKPPFSPFAEQQIKHIIQVKLYFCEARARYCFSAVNDMGTT